MRRAGRHHRRGLGRRVGDQRVDIDVRVGDAVDEGGIGAVLEQPPHQIGEQRLVRADGRVDAAGPVELVGTDDLLVERLAHAVQTLELVLAGPPRTGEGVDRRERAGVVGGELREDGLGLGQHLAGADHVGEVGVDLAGVDRIAVLPVDLGALDLAVPIGALDEPHHQPVTRPLGEVDQVIDDEGRAFAVGLHHEAEAVPAGKLGRDAERLEKVERELQPVSLLGIDVEADVVAPGQHRQRLEPGQQLADDTAALSPRIARMERRQLDRDARALDDAAPAGRLADGMDGRLVVAIVAVGIGHGQGGLAEHVVGVTEATRLEGSGMVERLGDRLAGDELLAHHAHGHVDAAPDQRFAALGDEALQRGGEARLVDRPGQLAGDDEPPGGGIDEQRRALPDMRMPVARGDLVADQRVARCPVGHPQQRLGEAHERHALVTRQGIFLHQPLDAATLRLRPQRADEPPRRGGGHGLLGAIEWRCRDQRRDALGLWSAAGGRDRGAQGRLHRDLPRQCGEGRVPSA